MLLHQKIYPKLKIAWKKCPLLLVLENETLCFQWHIFVIVTVKQDQNEWWGSYTDDTSILAEDLNEQGLEIFGYESRG